MITKDVLDQLYTPIYDKFLLQTFKEDEQVNQRCLIRSTTRLRNTSLTE